MSSHLKNFLACFLVSSVLAGCAVGPDNETPTFTFHTSWNESRAKIFDVNMFSMWWKTFRDPVLNEIMEDALKNNLDIGSAKLKLLQARSELKETVGGILPSSDATMDFSRSKSGVSTSNLFRYGLDASWEIDLFGKNYRAVETSYYSARAKEMDYYSTMISVIGDVATYYIESRGYQAQISLAERTASSQRKTVELTKAKMDAGSSSSIDTVKAAAASSTTEAAIPLLKISLAKSIHRLSVLTGSEPSALYVLLSKGSGVIPVSHDKIPVGIPADLLRNRPDVRSAEYSLSSSIANIGAKEAAMYPTISLTGSIASSSSKAGDLAKASSIAWSWGPSVSIPLFEGGKLVAAKEVAELERDQNFLTWKSYVLTALEDVENSLVSMKQDKMRKSRLLEAVKSYRSSFELSKETYKSGSSAFIDVLDAERSLYSSEDSLIQSRVANAIDVVSLSKALGAGWFPSAR